MEHKTEILKDHDFLTWYKGSCDRQITNLETGHLSILNRANKSARLFKKETYDECSTPEKSYIVKMIAKGVF